MGSSREDLQKRLALELEHAETNAAAEAFLAELPPYDLASLLRSLTEKEACRLLALVDPESAAKAVKHLEYPEQYRLLDDLERATAERILAQMSSDAVADLVGAVHPRQAQRLLDLLSAEYGETVRGLMDYPENTAGGRMTTNYISVQQQMRVEQVLSHIRAVGKEAETIAYIYVVNTAGQLVGVLSLRALLLAEPATPVSDLMASSVKSVFATADQEEVARLVAQYDLVAVPVVDEQGRMVGIITVDDLVDVIQAEATEDIQKLGGSAPLGETYFQTPVSALVRKRIGWILILFVAEAYTGTVLRHFEDTLEKVVALTFFIPLLIGTGGNTGSQVVTTLVRGLAVGEVRFKDMAKVLGREAVAGLFIGVVMGVATYIRAYTLGVGPQLGPIVGLTATFIVIWASAVAAVLPLILHRLKVDPAVVSGPFITTLVDGTGLFLYFTIARLMLGLA